MRHKRHSNRSTHALIVAYTTLILLILYILTPLKIFGQSAHVVLEYDSISVFEYDKDTLQYKVNSMFYFTPCSITLISQTEKVYDFLIPSWSDFDKYGIRVLHDTNTRLDDGGFIYHDDVHTQQLAAYFTPGMTSIKLVKKNQSGIIFH